jgi:hypothetical protein
MNLLPQNNIPKQRPDVGTAEPSASTHFGMPRTTVTPAVLAPGLRVDPPTSVAGPLPRQVSCSGYFSRIQMPPIRLWGSVVVASRILEAPNRNLFAAGWQIENGRLPPTVLW